MKKQFITRFIPIVFGVLLCFFQGFSQQVQLKRNIRVDVSNGGFHCPALTPRFENKVRNMKGVENFYIDKQSSYATFTVIDDSSFSEDALRKFLVELGYPSIAIKIESITK